MITNTLKFKSGNRIGSNPVHQNWLDLLNFNVLYKDLFLLNGIYPRFFYLFAKNPYEPLDQASKLYVTMKTAFLLALATAKRSSEIHALAVDANHLRLNQYDDSVSLTPQTGFLAKNQVPSICPDHIVIPNLAHNCKRKHSDRLLCPVRALKFYLKMTSSYHPSRTRLFLPIRGSHDISKTSVSRWIAYTIKLATGNTPEETFPF